MYSALASSDDAPAPAWAAFAHVLEGEIVWTRRIDRRSDAVIRLWGSPPRERLAAWLTETAAALQRIAARSDIMSEFDYRNLSGDPFRDRIDHMLEHVLLHSAQYRGESAGFANAAGVRIPDLDFIFWVRQGEPSA